MLKVDRWVVYYADGSTFTSEQGTWAEAPPFGVFAVVYYDPEGRKLTDRQGKDVSIYQFPGDKPTHVVDVEGTPVGMDIDVKMGLWTDNESYWRVHDYHRREVTP